MATTIDNFEIICEYITFPKTNESGLVEKKDEIVYLIEFVQELHGKTVVMDYFYIFTKNDLQKYKKLIMRKCKDNDAQAWIYIQPRNLVSVGVQAQIAMGIAISKQHYRTLRGIYPKVCKRSPGKSKDCIIELVTESKKLRSQFFEYMKDQCCNYTIIPSHNGCQYIVPRESVNLFDRKDLDIKHELSLIKKNPKVLLFV